MPPPITMRSPDGSVVAVPDDQVAVFADRGYTVEDAVAGVNRTADTAREEYYSTPSQKVRAAYAGVARGATFGLSDAAVRVAGAEDTLRGLKEANPIISTVGEIGGTLLTGKLPIAGAPMRAGSAIAKTAEGASALTKIGRAAAGAAVEGAAFGAGSGVSEVSLSKDPLTLEHAISTIGSSTLFGAGVGGGVGAITKAAGVGLRAAQSKLDDIASRGAVSAEADDAAKLALRDEVAAFRKELKEAKPWTAAKDSGIEELKTVGKRSFKADKALDNLLDDPKALVSRPQDALRHLRVQESALQDIANSTGLRAKLVEDVELLAMSSGGKAAAKKLAALDAITPTLEKNRALQAKIEAIIAKPVAAKEATLGSSMLGGAAFTGVTGLIGAIPVIGQIPGLAFGAGALASKAVTDGFGKLAAKQAGRLSKGIDTFLNVAAKAPPIAPVLASKTLSALRFSESKAPKAIETKPGKAAPKIAAQYKRVTDEVKQLTQYGPDGKTIMRPEARAKMAAHFDDVRQVDPIAADQAETLIARRITAISDRLTRKPDVFGVGGGPSRWQPSDMQMRADARFIAAVEDPAGVVDRLSTGQVTTEDRDAMKQVYPEMYADIQGRIMAQLPTLQKTLPYHRRLALSLFSGVPVDPAMHPRIVQVLQASFTDEAGTEGGQQAPKPEPSFGSVKNQEATPSQAREGTFA